jgi:Protein of unknown function (DUF3455)
MKNLQLKGCNRGFRAAGCVVPATLALLFLASAPALRAHDRDENLEINVPADLQVPQGNTVASKARGVGVQIYAWNAASSSWVFQAPSAVLFHEETGVAGIHYAGPTWQSTDGSKVVGKRLAGATVNPNAIPWLLLQAASTAGEGLFSDVTYIQRLRTRGGLAPTTSGTVDGQQVLVPYSAEYVFYKAAQ